MSQSERWNVVLPSRASVGLLPRGLVVTQVTFLPELRDSAKIAISKDLSVFILNNDYSPKLRWLVVHIYLAASQLGNVSSPKNKRFEGIC